MVLVNLTSDLDLG